MGFLWSLQSAPGHPRDTRMTINITNAPYIVTLKAYIGHLNLDQIYSSKEGQEEVLAGPPVAQIELERFCKAQGVVRHEVEEGNVRGALYLPAGLSFRTLLVTTYVWFTS